MTKEITLCVPKYVKKFLLSEPDYEHLEKGVIKAPRLSELGHLIHGFSRTIPYTQIFEPVEVPKNSKLLTVKYNCKKKSFDVPVERYPSLVAFLTEQFRASLIREVSALHANHPESEYGWMVKSFLDRRGVIVNDSLDKDMEWETAKKIYRDHLERMDGRNSKNRKLSLPHLSGPVQVCRA